MTRETVTPRLAQKGERGFEEGDRTFSPLVRHDPAEGYPRGVVDADVDELSSDASGVRLSGAISGDAMAYANGVTLDFSRPGKPTDNACIEAFNGRFRAECLNTHWFLPLADAAEKLEDWRRYYNEVRPHGAIGHKAPISLINPDGVTSPPS